MSDATMLATVLHAPGEFELAHVPVPTIEPDEALVRVAACGVCGSDLPRMLTKGAHHHPIICGHEFAGHIVELGSQVRGHEVDELVTVPPLIPCYQCAPCQDGHYGLCQDYDYFGSRRDGAYTTYVAVPQGNLLTVPDGVDPVAAALTDPAAIALHGLRQTDIGPGARVAVTGAGGPIGLFALQWARLMGATDVLGIELREEKFPLLEQAGATTLSTGGEELTELAGPEGYDVVVECAAAVPAIDAATRIAGRRAQVVFIGIPTTEVTLSLRTYQHFLRQEVRLMGSWNSFSAPFPGTAWTASLDGFASGRLQWEFMITHRLPMSEVPRMIHQMGDGLPSSKVLFEPEG